MTRDGYPGGDMGEHRDAEPPPERTLYEYVLIVWKFRRMLAAVAAAFALAGLVTGLIRTKKYTAECVLLPPAKGGSGLMAALATQSPALAQLAASATGASTPVRLYAEILQMEPVRLSLVQRFGLDRIYDTETPDGAIGRLKKRTKVKTTRAGFISVKFTDKDPELAARVANEYAEELNRQLRRLNVNQAQFERSFLEERLQTVGRDLKDSEEALREFQKRNKAVGLEQAARTGIEVYAQLKARALEFQTELEVARTYRSEGAPEVELLKARIGALREQMVALEEPRPRTAPSNPGSLEKGEPVPEGPIVHITEIPDMSLRYVRLLRDFKIKEKLFEYLTTQLESARIREAGDPLAVQVAQAARPPEKPSSLGLVPWAFAWTLAGCFLGAVAAIVREERG